MSIRDNIILDKPRILPVFLLVDVSGSMRGEKIGTVNVAIKEMITQFSSIKHPKGLINLCIIAFGGSGIKTIKKLSPINEDDVFDFEAEGQTPLGGAIEYLTTIVCDKNIIDDRAYSPAFILISDGNPTDFENYTSGMSVSDILNWEPLNNMFKEKRCNIAVRVAMGIGKDQDANILKAFINNSEIPVCKASDSSDIDKFFKWVTMSLGTKSVSTNPEATPMLNPRDYIDDDKMEF